MIASRLDGNNIAGQSIGCFRHVAIFYHLMHSGPANKPFGLDTLLPDTPQKLLSFPTVISTHPIIEVTRLCLYQLLRYFGHVSLASTGIVDDLACGGFSSGIIPAAAVAASSTVDEYLEHGVSAFRLAFWTGYRNWQRCRQVEADGDEAAAPWSLMSEYPRLSLAGVTDNGWSTISGCSKDLNNLRDICTTEWKLPTRSLHIHGCYHGGPALQGLVEIIFGDMRHHNINFPRFEDLKRPLLSPSNGSRLEPANSNGKSLLELLLDLILVDSFDWMSVSRNIAAQINSTMEGNQDVKVSLTCVGPSSGILCSGIKKRVVVMPGNLVVDDLWLTREYSGSAAASISSEDIAIIGMAVNMPGGPTTREFWDLLLQAQSTVQEVDDSAQETRRLDAKHGNFLDDIWGLDNSFFGISQREAKSMDPQQKVLLHVVKAALEDAGYVPDITSSFQRETVGCYVGVATGDYTDNLKHDIDVYYSPGKYACNRLIGIHADMYMGLNRGHFLSPSGQCKPFDANADGYCRAEGCGMFVLKRLSVAIAENDRVLGVIKGIEVNQSGNSQSITHPDAGTQASLMSRLLKKAGIDAQSIDVVEAHGDNGEVRSLHKVFAEQKSLKSVLVSSVKGNIGHCEAASGSAGLAKLLLMLRHGQVPMQASLQTVNPSLAKFVSGPLVIPRKTTPWTRSGNKLRRAVLNNFGAAGSNAALILEEYLPPKRPATETCTRSAFPFLISARSTKAATQWKDDYQILLSEQHRELRVEDICYTASARRQPYEYTFAVPCSSTLDLLSGVQNLEVSTGKRGTSNQRVMFIFSGQGSSYEGMGVVGFIMGSTATSSRASITEQAVLSQCATVVLQYALSLAIANVISIEDCLHLAASRAQSMARICKSRSTGMLACRFSFSEAKDRMRQSEDFDGLEIVCRNSPRDCVVGGSLQKLSAFASHCSAACLETKQLVVPYAFHSAAMDPIADSLIDLAQSIKLSEPSIPVFSTVLGRRLTYSDLDSSYFSRHTRQPVLFVDALQQLEIEEPMEQATIIEIGPHPSVLPLVSASLSSSGCKMIPSLRKDSEPWVSLSSALCQLAPTLKGIHWTSVFDGSDAKLIDLPGHPLYPVHSAVQYVEERVPDAMSIKTLQTTRFLFGLYKLTSTQNDVDLVGTHMSSIGKFIAGHNVGGTPICPASVYFELVLEAALLTDKVRTDEIWTVKNMTFSRPLIYRGEIDDRTSIRVALKHEQDTSVEFRVEYASDRSEKHEICVEGIVELVSTQSLSSMWLRQHAFVKRQRDYLLSGELSGINYIQRAMLYEILFPRVVEYSSDYHSIQDLSMSASGGEGYGSVRFPKGGTEGDLVSPPVVSDTLLHAAGFIANAHAKSTDVYICGRVESLVVKYPNLDFTGSYKIYCNLLHVSRDTVLADSFLLNINDEIVAAAQGVHFKKLRLSSFQASISRAEASKESHSLSPNVESSHMTGSTKYGTPRTPESPVQNGSESPDTASMLLKLVANTCGISDAHLKTDHTLSDLGIDSMMLLELSTAIDKSALGKLQSENLGPAVTLKSMLESVNGGLPQLLGPALTPVDSAVNLTDQKLVDNSKRGTKPRQKSAIEVLASICGADVVNLDSDTTLDSIGVDSMMRIELHEALERNLGTSISLEKLAACINIGELEHMDNLINAPLSTTNVEVSHVLPKPNLLRSSRSKKAPCYLFHDGSGLCSMYQRLGDVDRDVYGFASPASSAQSLEAMAKAYVDSIELQGDRELSLGGTAGWSFGGVVALEAARQLTDKGYKVKGVVLIDSPFPDDHVALPTPVIDHIIGSAAFASISSATRELLSSRFRHHAALLEAYQPPRSKFESLKAVLLQSQDTFDTKKLCGVDYPWLSDKETHVQSSMKWQQYFKQDIVIHDIPGNHFEPFMDGNVSDTLYPPFKRRPTDFMLQLSSVSKRFQEAISFIDV
nr:orsellinic acid synthase [Quercus suber]